MSLATMSVPMNTNYSYFTVRGMARDAAREYLASKAVAVGSKYLLFLDDDTAPPSFAVHELMYTLDNAEDNVAVCAGIYCTKTNPAVPIVSQEIGGGPFWKWKTGDVFEAPFIGTGCMMINCELMAKLPRPWFKDIGTVEEAKEYNLEIVEDNEEHCTNKYRMTDDIFFCQRLKDAGYKCLAHGGVLPIHFDQQGKAYPLPDDCYPVKNGNKALFEGFGFRPVLLENPDEPVAADLALAS